MVPSQAASGRRLAERGTLDSSSRVPLARPRRDLIRPATSSRPGRLAPPCTRGSPWPGASPLAACAAHLRPLRGRVPVHGRSGTRSDRSRSPLSPLRHLARRSAHASGHAPTGGDSALPSQPQTLSCVAIAVQRSRCPRRSCAGHACRRGPAFAPGSVPSPRRTHAALALRARSLPQVRGGAAPPPAPRRASRGVVGDSAPHHPAPRAAKAKTQLQNQQQRQRPRRFAASSASLQLRR